MLLEIMRKGFFPNYRFGFGEMTRGKALKILNISRGDNIAERYRILAKLNHPDLNGSPYLLEKINQAKKYLDVSNEWL
ncbi:DnaJ-like protein subfamily C member 19 [Pancytospora epiphaga]|nr:DnaJ-like protein subfamily C member 19 [Pancytospora epiphaga]